MFEILYPDDVAEIWTAERRRTEGADAPEVKPDRVHDFLRWSKRTPPGVLPKHRYENNPMPYPHLWRRNKPAWRGNQQEDLLEWWHERLPQIPSDPDRVAQRKKDWADDPNGLIR